MSEALSAGSITIVLDALRPERDAFVALLAGLTPQEWAAPTECPAYTKRSTSR
jgi:hypothetical protein